MRAGAGASLLRTRAAALVPQAASNSPATDQTRRAPRARLPNSWPPELTWHDLSRSYAPQTYGSGLSRPRSWRLITRRSQVRILPPL